MLFHLAVGFFCFVLLCVGGFWCVDFFVWLFFLSLSSFLM